MSKLKRHKPLLMLADAVLTKMSTNRLLAHYQKSKIVSECKPNWDDPTETLLTEAVGLYLVKVSILLAKREHVHKWR